MRINTYLAGIAAAAGAALAVSSAAHAATVVPVGTTNGGGYFSIAPGQTSFSPVINATFGAMIAGPSTAFDYDFTFTIDNNGTGSGNLSYSFAGPGAELSITDVLINGTDYAASITGSSTTGYSLIVNGVSITKGALNTISVIGETGAQSTSSTFTGNANFVMAVVPEPATWAMMIGGMGLMGGMLRRRKAGLQFA